MIFFLSISNVKSNICLTYYIDVIKLISYLLPLIIIAVTSADKITDDLHVHMYHWRSFDCSQRRQYNPNYTVNPMSIFLCSSLLVDTNWHPNAYSDLQHLNIVLMLNPTGNIFHIHFIYSSVPWFRYLVDKIVIFLKNRWRLSLLFIKLFKLTLFFSTKVFL